MPSPLKAIDEWLLSRFESASRFAQVNFGTTSEDLACCCWILSIEEILRDRHVIGPWRWVLIICAVLRLAGSALVDRTRKSEWADNGFRNFEKVRSEWVRQFCLVGVLFNVLVSVIVLFAGGPQFLKGPLWFEAYAAAVYFHACDDLPPSVSRLKRTLKKWLLSSQEKPLVPATNSVRLAQPAP